MRSGHTSSRRVRIFNENSLKSGHDLFSLGFAVRLNDRKSQRGRPYDAGHLLFLQLFQRHATGILVQD